MRFEETGKGMMARKSKELAASDEIDLGGASFTIGRLLRRARERANLTQEQLAARMNTRKSAISRIENHGDNINLTTLQRYAAALGKRLRISVT